MIGSLSPRGRVLTFDPPTVEVPKGVLRKNLITTTLPPARHRLGTSTSAGSLFGALHDSPAAKAVLIGAGGLSLFGAATAHAAPVNAEATTTAAKGPRSIVYVGMNKDSSYEVAGLRAKIGEGGVTYLTSSKTQDGLTLNGKSYDLTKPEGRSDYAAALGLPADRAAALAEILADTPEGARDEAAQLARTFREAEQGKRTIERIVLSGHGVGSGVWGDGNGTLSLSVVGKLTLLFPKAAAQVEDFMLAGCYSGGEGSMETYRAMFPNLKTAWAYTGSAPGSVSGAVPHILRWEKATRGSGSDALKRSLVDGTRKGENVAVWTVTKGYDNGQPQISLEEARGMYNSSAGIVAGYASGESVQDNPQSGPLRDHYNSIQRLLARSDLPATDRAQLEGERDFVIRLLFHKNVSTMFQATYGSSISAAFTELGLPTPDFAKLSRKDALAKIAEFDAKLAAKPSASAATKAMSTRLNDTLKSLKPAAVPPAWI